MEQSPRCPLCGAETEWPLDDRYQIGEHVFSERTQVCGSNCGWEGYTALFTWPDNPPMKIKRAWEGDLVELLENAEPME